MSEKKFCVIGLGYFGYNLALRLAEAGAEVLAVDHHQDRIDDLADKVTLAVCMDSKDAKALKSLNLQEMDAVIIAIGKDFNNSILTTSHLQEMGVKNIICARYNSCARTFAQAYECQRSACARGRSCPPAIQALDDSRCKRLDDD